MDLSISSTGFCIIQNDKIVRFGRIVTEGKPVSTKSKKPLEYEYFYASESEDNRMYYMTTILEELIEQYDITDICIENCFFGKNPKTGISLSKLKGFTSHLGMTKICKIHYLLPTQVRKLLNQKGSSDKELVSLYIKRNYKIDLGIFSDKQGKFKNSDIYDAIAIGIAFARMNKIELTYEG